VDACEAAHEAAGVTENCASCQALPETCDELAEFVAEGGCAHGCTAAGGAAEAVYEACIKPIGDDLGCEHVDGDDGDDMSGSIASSSASILAFGASFFLSLARQAQ
jgi:hypothetical protein